MHIKLKKIKTFVAEHPHAVLTTSALAAGIVIGRNAPRTTPFLQLNVTRKQFEQVATGLGEIVYNVAPDLNLIVRAES